MKLYGMFTTAAITLTILSGCAPALTPETVTVSLTPNTAHFVAGTVGKLQVEVGLSDEVNTETYEVVLFEAQEAGAPLEISSFEGQGELVAPVEFAVDPGVSNLGIQIRNSGGEVLAESDVVEVEGVEPDDVELRFVDAPKKWLIDTPVSLKLSSSFDLSTPGLQIVLENLESGQWKKVSEFDSDLQLAEEFVVSSEAEQQLRTTLYLGTEPLKSTEEITVFFQTADTMLSALAYQSQQATRKGAKGTIAFRKSVTYPGLYDWSKDDTSIDLRYNYTERFVVIAGTVRPDPSWILGGSPCQIAYEGQTPPGKTFIFDTEWFANDRYGNDYPPAKASIHSTFINGEMWLYLPPRCE